MLSSAERAANKLFLDAAATAVVASENLRRGGRRESGGKKKTGGNLELLQRDHALGDELVGVLLQHVLLPADLLVHQRLGEHGLVHLVVAEAPVAHLEADGKN